MLLNNNEAIVLQERDAPYSEWKRTRKNSDEPSRVWLVYQTLLVLLKKTLFLDSGSRTHHIDAVICGKLDWKGKGQKSTFEQLLPCRFMIRSYWKVKADQQATYEPFQTQVHPPSVYNLHGWRTERQSLFEYKAEDLGTRGPSVFSSISSTKGRGYTWWLKFVE